MIYDLDLLKFPFAQVLSDICTKYSSYFAILISFVTQSKDLPQISASFAKKTTQTWALKGCENAEFAQLINMSMSDFYLRDVGVGHQNFFEG